MVSVIVPIYNAQRHLRECLDSVLAQRVSDLEVVLVDDGSTDDSPAIAQEYVERDDRFSLVTQPNGGLAAARNTGVGRSTGEFIAFLDSGDVLPPRGLQLLLRSLDESGSDFATGNINPLTSIGTARSPFLARAFARDRPAAHVTKNPELIADRIATNKLWRRSFWERHGLEFPVGKSYQDIPVVVPAHFMAKAVDVIAEPTYLYRVREGGEISTIRRRLEPQVLLDRVDACERVSDQLGKRRPKRAKRLYDESVVADDLASFLAALPGADAEYRELFLDRVNAFLDKTDPEIFEPLPAIDRLKWHLIRRRLVDECVQVQRFQRIEMADRPPVRVGGAWHGDYPFRDDPQLNVPAGVYELRQELTPAGMLHAVAWEDGHVRIDGAAWIRGIGAPAEGAQQLEVTALRTGRLRGLRRLRLRTSGIRLATKQVHLPDVTGLSRQPLADVSWSGFEATLPAGRLSRRGRLRDTVLEVYVTITAGDVKRRTLRLATDVRRPVRAADQVTADGTLLRIVPSAGRGAQLHAIRRWAMVRGQREAGGQIELTGEVHGYRGRSPRLELIDDKERVVTCPVSIEGNAFTVRVDPLELLQGRGAAEDQEPDDASVWELHLVEGSARRRVALEETFGVAATETSGFEVALHRTARGHAALAVRLPRPVITAARWTGDDILEVEGELGTASMPLELVLVAREHAEAHVFEVSATDAGGFTAQLVPMRRPTLAGDLPLGEGVWHICARPVGDQDPAHLVSVPLGRRLLRELPPRRTAGHKVLVLGAASGDRAALVVHRDLDDDERGAYHQRRLRRDAYVARRSAPLRDAVLYASFGGRQFSDNPRAIHEELVARGAPLEHLWIVRDGACRVPPTATVVRERSREYHELLATSRYLVFNDHFPNWFSRRDDQLCLQTWHGTPLKKLGLDVSAQRKIVRGFEQHWDQHVRNWQYVLSPNAFSTPILKRAYGVEGEMLELGYPRNDRLAAPGREERTRELRARLGLPESARTILYAPTYRDQMVDQRGKPRLDLHLELDKLRGALGPETVVLFRKHHYIVDPVPTTADGFVRDVSSYPDGTELLLAADVLITDYSSIMFDFAITGRPIFFFTYDLATYADEIRGFYFDFIEAAPGPLLQTTDELSAALRDLDGVRAQYADRYAAFVQRFCELDDGNAAARVVDRFIGGSASGAGGRRPAA